MANLVSGTDLESTVRFLVDRLRIATTFGCRITLIFCISRDLGCVALLFFCAYTCLSILVRPERRKPRRAPAAGTIGPRMTQISRLGGGRWRACAGRHRPFEALYLPSCSCTGRPPVVALLGEARNLRVPHTNLTHDRLPGAVSVKAVTRLSGPAREESRNMPPSGIGLVFRSLKRRAPNSPRPDGVP